MYKKVVLNRCPECGTLIITPNGNVYPCGAIHPIDSQIICGNVKQVDLEEIINKIRNDADFMHVFNCGVGDYYEYIHKKNPSYVFIDECEVCTKIFTVLSEKERELCRMKK